MSEADQTIISDRGATGTPGVSPKPEPPQSSRRKLFLTIGGIGCALLLCAVLLIGGGAYVARDQLDVVRDQLDDIITVAGLSSPTAMPAFEPPTVEATNTPTPTLESTATLEATAENEPGPTGTAAAEGGSQNPAGQEDGVVASEPEIGAITFALGATEDYEPIDPATSFEGEVTEVHAIFEYDGLSPDDSWERVWYLDGVEILRTEEPWSGAVSGIFDYFISAGGEPLSPGEWILELYVEDELLATGSFTIVGEEVAEAAATEEPQPDATAAASAGTGQTRTGTPEAEATAVQQNAPDTPTPVPPTSTPASQTYKLAYTKWDGGNHNLYIGDTNGGAEQFIVGRAAGPSWTPDGQYIFFYGEEGVDRQTVDGAEFVFDGISNGIVRIDVSPIPASIGDVQLSQDRSWKGATIRWANVSPNGQMVAYDARTSGDYRIYFLGTDENQQFKYELLGEQADWSPDSQKLVYRSGRDGQTGLWISNRDDSGHTLITGSNDSFPAWSPDGNTIAFARDVDGNVDIYRMNPDGANLQRLTEAPGPDTLPVFTPDGQIIFRSARSGSWGIWKMNGDGSNQQEIIPNAGVGPDWAYSRMSVLP